jgi:hypothetical protein
VLGFKTGSFQPNNPSAATDLLVEARLRFDLRHAGRIASDWHQSRLEIGHSAYELFYLIRVDCSHDAARLG